MPSNPANRAALIEAELRALERTIQALPEPAMRRERLLERLETAGPIEAYEIVAAVLRRPGRAAPQLSGLREILQQLLREGGALRPLDPGLCTGVEAEAIARGDTFVMRLFRTAEAAEAMQEPSAALPRDVAQVPLGVRRALARGIDLDLLERLLLDADPVVIDHLLDNPRITEAHVVRIASRRPIAASTLERIARCRRFGQRPAVRIALARNPYLATQLALQLLGVMPLPELREIASDATLHEETQRHARAELARRKQSRRSG